MSRIYMDNGVVEKNQKKREAFLVEQNRSMSISFMRLADVGSDNSDATFLICTHKDIDEMGEKLQQKALSYFPEAIDLFAAKITELLKNGYSKVYLISDHGFVLTGLLDESDKVEATIDGENIKTERFIRASKKQDLGPNFIEIKQG